MSDTRSSFSTGPGHILSTIKCLLVLLLLIFVGRGGERGRRGGRGKREAGRWGCQVLLPPSLWGCRGQDPVPSQLRRLLSQSHDLFVPTFSPKVRVGIVIIIIIDLIFSCIFFLFSK